MSHAFRVSDEEYQALSRVAAAHNQMPEDLFDAWVRELRAQDQPSPALMNGQTGQYDPASDPLAPYLGAFEATEPDAVRRHDDYLGEAAADSHAS